jgi:dTMP kinase
MPDMTFFMDTPPEIGLNRAIDRGDTNKFEAKKIDFHNKIYQRFKIVASIYSERIALINAGNKSIDEIQQFIRGSIFTK